MMQLHEGQCGLCAHFGEHHAPTQQLIQIRTSKQADEHVTDQCGHPRHAPLNLMVTPISGCEGFEPAATDKKQMMH
jgi:hypothetical protein